ncbi:methyltransferase family protein [Actinokineospora sp. NPDC004072]
MSAPAATRSASAVTALTRVLFVAGTALLVVGTVRHLAAGGAVHLQAGLMTAAYLAWVAMEIPVTFRASGHPAAETRTLTAYVCARMSVVITAVLTPAPWGEWSPWLLLAPAAFLGGVLLRRSAVRALASQYTHHVVRRSDHVLVTHGPYRRLRHPAYSGMLAANAAFVAFFPGPASVTALVALAAALAWRIRTEERVLWSLPGYPDFAARRARLVPGVW